MPNIEKVPFIPEHAFAIELRAHEATYIDRDFLVAIGETGICCTCLIDGAILAIVGFFEKWPGVIQVFVIPSIHVPRAPKSFVKYVKAALDRLATDFNYHRLQTESKADEQTDKWMRVLGFECEGVLKSYSSAKEDYKMWARII